MPKKTQRRGQKSNKSRKNRTLRGKRQRGGGNCAQSGGMGVLDTAIVPFGILALQRYMQKKVKVPKGLSRRRLVREKRTKQTYLNILCDIFNIIIFHNEWSRAY